MSYFWQKNVQCKFTCHFIVHGHHMRIKWSGASNTTNKFVHWVNLLGQPLLRIHVFKIFRGEPQFMMGLTGTRRLISLTLTKDLLSSSWTARLRVHPKSEVWITLIMSFARVSLVCTPATMLNIGQFISYSLIVIAKLCGIRVQK